MTATREIPVSTPPCRYPFYNDLGGEGDYYFNARWYDASTGRFITEDPARDGQNWFNYVSNNPLKFVDPTGMREVVDEDERGNLTVENPDGTLKDRNHGNDQTRKDDNRDDDNKTKKAEVKSDDLLEQPWGDFFSDSMEGFVESFDHYKESFITAQNEGIREGLQQFSGINSVGDVIEALDKMSIAAMGAGGISFAAQTVTQLESATSYMGAQMGSKMTTLGLKTPLKNAGPAQTPRYYNPETGRYATSELAKNRKQDAYSSVGKFSRGVAEGYLAESTPTSDNIAPEPRSRPQAAGQAVGRGINQLQSILKEMF